MHVCVFVCNQLLYVCMWHSSWFKHYLQLENAATYLYALTHPSLHTHHHTHTHELANIYLHAYHPCAYTYTYTLQINTHLHTHVYEYTHTYARAYRHTHTHMHIQMYIVTRLARYTIMSTYRSNTHTLIHTRANIHIHTNTHTQSHTCIPFSTIGDIQNDVESKSHSATQFKSYDAPASRSFRPQRCKTQRGV